MNFFYFLVASIISSLCLMKPVKMSASSPRIRKSCQTLRSAEERSLCIVRDIYTEELKKHLLKSVADLVPSAMTAQTSHRGSETDPPKFIKHIVDQQTEQPDEDRMKPMDHVVVPIRRQNSTSTAIEIALDIPNLGKESCIQNAELLVQLAGGLPADELALEAEGPEGFKFVNFSLPAHGNSSEWLKIDLSGMGGKDSWKSTTFRIVSVRRSAILSTVKNIFLQASFTKCTRKNQKRETRSQEDAAAAGDICHEGRNCCMRSTEISFDAIGWTWVLAPKSFNFTYCFGGCGPKEESAMHSQITEEDELLCCSTKFSESTLGIVIQDSEGNIHQRKIPNVNAAKCTCH